MSTNAVELSYKTTLVELQQFINFKWVIHKKLPWMRTWLHILAMATKSKYVKAINKRIVKLGVLNSLHYAWVVPTKSKDHFYEWGILVLVNMFYFIKAIVCFL